MTLAIQTKPVHEAPGELLSEFRTRVADGSDPAGVARAVAEMLRERLAHARVSVFRHDAASQSLLLLACAPHDSEGPATGTRSPMGADALGRAVRQGSPQRTLNAYVEPDFVRRLPGETRSDLAVPVHGGSGVVGAIHLEYTSPHAPTPAAQAAAELLAWPLALALATGAAGEGAAPTGEQSGRRLRQASTLAVLAEQLARKGDLPEALRRIVGGALELVPGGAAVLLLRHSERQMLEVAATSGAALLAEGELVPLEETLPGSVFASAHPRSVPRVGTGADRFCAADAERGIRDALVVPLVSGGRSYGVLAVLNRADGGESSVEDVELLQSLANQAAAVESMRQIGPLRQRLSDASMIAEVGRAMTGTLGLDEVLALVVQAAQMLVNGQCAAVGMVSEVGDSLKLVSTTGVLRRSQGQSIPLAGSLMGWVVRNGEAVITPGVSDDPRSFAHEVRQGPGAVAPLESRGEIRGALLVSRREGAPLPSDEDLDALRKLGAYAAIAIDNAQLYQEQKELSQALQAQTEELERAYAELRASQDRLLVSEKMAALGRVTAGIAHEINSPLGSVLNCLQLAQGYASEYQASAEDPEVTPEDHLAIATDLVETLGLAEGAARRVAQFVRTIKSQTRIGEEVRRAFDPVQEIRNTVVLLQHQLLNRNVRVQVEAEDDLELTGDPGRFAMIVQNLLSNAVDAYQGDEYRGAEHAIWIRLRAGDGALVLEIEDHGCGIPEDIRPRIFDYLFTTKDIGEGTGLGLSMVHSTVTTYFDGEIDFRSEVGSGSTFVITFPDSGRTG